MIEKYFIGLFFIFQIYGDEKIETAQMVCLHIARLKSDRRFVTQSNSCTIHTLKHDHFNI